jgi:hypothetical protein
MPTDTNIFVDNSQDISIRVQGLRRPAFALLRLLVQLKTGRSPVIKESVEDLALLMCKSSRSIQTSLKVLKDAGLIIRNQLHGKFGPCVTMLVSSSIAECVMRPFAPKASKRTRSVLIGKGLAPYEYLKDPLRCASLEVDLQHALSASDLYWDFILKAFESIGFSAPLMTEVQSRSRKTGKRTGVHTFRRRKIWSKNLTWEMSKVAHFAKTNSLEATFRVLSSQHPLILVDDLSLESVSNFLYACAILETSPSNFQATLIAPRPLSRTEFMLVEEALIADHCGDLGAKGPQQLRRFPGSINNKPALTTPFVTRVHQVTKTLTLTTQELDQLIARGLELRPQEDRATAITHLTRVTLCISSAANSEPGAIASADAQPADPSAGTRDRSDSGKEFGKAIELIRSGIDYDSICEHIFILATKRSKYGSDAKPADRMLYAQRTVENARKAYDPNKFIRLRGQNAIESGDVDRNRSDAGVQ